MLLNIDPDDFDVIDDNKPPCYAPPATFFGQWKKESESTLFVTFFNLFREQNYIIGNKMPIFWDWLLTI
ncbi:hypothetical protein Zmor_006221 [Zophobas morio]|uniref:Uncharacterized protein n=1 Tax=Zophobas morio TaxID=2755281 RepID=A0AA38ITE0_9CUCU|nr:hypothetical protein Zmor_006221 [Zophobas morio]